MTMKSVQVRFPEEELERIDNLVKKGEYPSRAEFIRDAVRKTEMINALTELRNAVKQENISLEELLETGRKKREELYEEMFGGA